MRRRADDWINATHILKVAGLDKPARTRILEREVQKGVHEKVQGGYGKYQGISSLQRLLNGPLGALCKCDMELTIVFRNMGAASRGSRIS